MAHFFTRNHLVTVLDMNVEPVCLHEPVDMNTVAIEHPEAMFRYSADNNALKVELALNVSDIRDYSAERKAALSRVVMLLRLERMGQERPFEVLAKQVVMVPAPNSTSAKMKLNTFVSYEAGALRAGRYLLTVEGGTFPDNASMQMEFNVVDVGDRSVSELFRPHTGGFAFMFERERLERSFPVVPLDYYVAENCPDFDFGSDDDEEEDDEDGLEGTASDWLDESPVTSDYVPRCAHFIVENLCGLERPKATLVFRYADGDTREVMRGGVPHVCSDHPGGSFVSFSSAELCHNGEAGPVCVELRILGETVATMVGEKTVAGTEPTMGDFRGELLEPLADTTLKGILKRLARWKNAEAEETPKVSTMKELERMVGLEDVKRKVDSYMTLVRFYKLRAERGISSVMPPLHALFLGAPGTGKTTVAKLMGQLMHEAGVLSKGHVVVRERSQIVGRHYGDESAAMRKALEEAEGGVLFIDEAYTLYREADPKDPGREAIETLLTALADGKKRDWMLILGGYEDKILKMFEMNPGLSSRFPQSNRYRFADYSAGELLEIAERFCEDNAYHLSAGAREKLATVLAADVQGKDATFGNARHVLNMLETEVFPAMAARVARVEEPTEETLTCILAEDVPGVKPAAPQRRLGFRV